MSAICRNAAHRIQRQRIRSTGRAALDESCAQHWTSSENTYGVCNTMHVRVRVRQYIYAHYSFIHIYRIISIDIYSHCSQCDQLNATNATTATNEVNGATATNETNATKEAHATNASL
jgi:hypothetical protein